MHIYIYIYTHTHKYGEREPHITVGASKYKIYRAGQQAGDLEKSCYNLQSEGSLEAESFFLQASQSFSLSKSSAAQMRAIYIMESYLLYSESTDLNVNYI